MKADIDAAGHKEVDSIDQALDSRSETGGRRPAPKRRRRAAGSAQGSSGEVSQVDTSASGAGSSFAASAAETEPDQKKPEQKKPGQEPVMLGVGVSAEQISRAQ